MSEHIRLIEQAIETHDKLAGAYNEAMSLWTVYKFGGTTEEIEAADQRADCCLSLIDRAVLRVERRMAHVTYSLMPIFTDPQRQTYMLKFYVDGQCVRTDHFPRTEEARVLAAVERLAPMKPEPFWKWKTDETIRDLRLARLEAR